MYGCFIKFNVQLKDLVLCKLFFKLWKTMNLRQDKILQ